MLSSADQPGDTVTYHLVGLTPGWEVCRFNTWLGHCVVFLEVEHNYLLHSLRPPRSKNGYQLTVREILWNAEEVLGGGEGSWEVATFPIASCDRNQVRIKLWPNEPFGSSTDVTTLLPACQPRSNCISCFIIAISFITCSFTTLMNPLTPRSNL